MFMLVVNETVKATHPMDLIYKGSSRRFIFSPGCGGCEGGCWAGGRRSVFVHSFHPMQSGKRVGGLVIWGILTVEQSFKQFNVAA